MNRFCRCGLVWGTLFAGSLVNPSSSDALKWPFVPQTTAPGIIKLPGDWNLQYHEGVDIPKEKGTNVLAVKHGYVIDPFVSPTPYLHHLLIADAADATTGWVYLHLSFDVARFTVNAEVNEGDIIGQVADFPAPAPDHLHFSRWNSDVDNRFTGVHPFSQYQPAERPAQQLVLPPDKIFLVENGRFDTTRFSLVGGKPVIYGDVDIVAEAHTTVAGTLGAGVYLIGHSISSPPGVASVSLRTLVNFETVPSNLFEQFELVYALAYDPPSTHLRGHYIVTNCGTLAANGVSNVISKSWQTRVSLTVNDDDSHIIDTGGSGGDPAAPTNATAKYKEGGYTINIHTATYGFTQTLTTPKEVILDNFTPVLQMLTHSPSALQQNQSFTLTLRFSESMNPANPPVVTYGLIPPFTTYAVTFQSWQTTFFPNDTWVGVAMTPPSDFTRTYTFRVDAHDLAGNPLSANGTVYARNVDGSWPGGYGTGGADVSEGLGVAGAGGGSSPVVYRLFGAVWNSAGTPVSGVTLFVSGGASQSYVTGSDGAYAFIDLPQGGNFTITPSYYQIAFDPPNRSYSNLQQEWINQDFLAIDPPISPPSSGGTGSGGNGCVAAGTPVATPGGFRPIEFLRPGDWVVGWDGQARVPAQVTHVWAHTGDWPLHQVEGLWLTGNHLVWKEGGWMPASTVSPVVLTQRGRVYDITTTTGSFCAAGSILHNLEHFLFPLKKTPTERGVLPPTIFQLGQAYSFPNPAKGVNPTLHLEVGLAEDLTVVLYDQTGRELWQTTLPGSQVVIVDGVYAYELPMDATGLASGIYLAKITAKKAGHPEITKIVKLAVVK